MFLTGARLTIAVIEVLVLVVFGHVARSVVLHRRPQHQTRPADLIVGVVRSRAVGRHRHLRRSAEGLALPVPERIVAPTGLQPRVRARRGAARGQTVQRVVAESPPAHHRVSIAHHVAHAVVARRLLARHVARNAVAIDGRRLALAAASTAGVGPAAQAAVDGRIPNEGLEKSAESQLVVWSV